jgi:hypothetical protein
MLQRFKKNAAATVLGWIYLRQVSNRLQSQVEFIECSVGVKI